MARFAVLSVLRLFGVLSILIASEGQSHAQVDALTRLTTEAPEAWYKYYEALFHMQAQVVTHRVDLRRDRLTLEKLQYTVKLDRGSAMFEQSELASEKGSGYGCSTLGIGRNSLYEFEIGKTKKGLGGDWFIQKVVFEDKKGSQDDRFKKRDAVSLIGGQSPSKGDAPFSYCLQWLGAGLLIENAYIPKLVMSKEFRWKSAVEKSNGSGGFWIEAQYAYAPPADSAEYLGNGTIVFDPDRYWQVVSAEYECNWFGELMGTVEYNVQYTQLDTLPVWEQRVRKIKTRKPSEVDVTSEHEESDSAKIKPLATDPTESAFKLSAYGFPEPKAPGESLWGPRLVMLGLTIAILAAIVLRKTSKSSTDANSKK